MKVSKATTNEDVHNNTITHLNDLLPVLGGVHGRLCEQDLAVARVDVELLRSKRVVPEVTHVVPVPHNAILHGVVDLQHGAQFARFVPHHQVLREVKGQRVSQCEKETHNQDVQISPMGKAFP